MVDEAEGIQTKPQYALYEVGVGRRMAGKVFNHLGIARTDPGEGAGGLPVAEGALVGPPRLPLLNEQVSMQNREVISEPLMLGVKVCVRVWS